MRQCQCNNLLEFEDKLLMWFNRTDSDTFPPDTQFWCFPHTSSLEDMSKLHLYGKDAQQDLRRLYNKIHQVSKRDQYLLWPLNRNSNLQDTSCTILLKLLIESLQDKVKVRKSIMLDNSILLDTADTLLIPHPFEQRLKFCCYMCQLDKQPV